MPEPEVAPAARRDRSPAFPYIGLEKAVERTRMLYAKAKRHDVRIVDAAADWGLGPKSSATLQTVGALLAFGLIEDSGSGETRKVRVSDTGWRVLEDDRPGVRETLLGQLALKPRLIAQYHDLWKKDGRPDEAHAVSQLKFDSGFTDEAASKFLRVYDETIKFLPHEAAAPAPVEEVEEEVEEDEEEGQSPPPKNPEPRDRTVYLQGSFGLNPAGERVLATGMLSRTAQFRILVSGHVGTKEIDVLIRKLELDKEVLADDGPEGGQ